MDSDMVTYDVIKSLAAEPSNKAIIHLDVREPKELQETGTYPHSINIPLGELEESFALSDEQFQTKFEKNKPGNDDLIIVSCRGGGRSAKAQVLLRGLGYKNVKNYAGGWLDWEKNQKE